MENKMNTMKKLLLSTLLGITTLASSVDAQVYDYNYVIAEEKNTTTLKSLEDINLFMYGEFEEIIRFEPFDYQNGELDEDDQGHYDEMIEKIRSYIDEGKDIKITIMGNTDAATDDANEANVDSDSYANIIQNWFRYELDSDEAKEISLNYAENMQDMIIYEDINETLISVEARGGNDLGFTDETGDGRDMSNRVLVAMYVLKPEDIDSDRDGVLDSADQCPGTPRGAAVDKYGCPKDSDNDGVFDYKDECPDTPVGVDVDKKGCPLDSDGDGVENYKDRCPNTAAGVPVDKFGCPRSQVLNINFKSRSAKIPKDYREKILKFAEFLKLYPVYQAEVVGHTDSKGKTTVNMKLSQDRAQSVVNALVAEGVAVERLRAVGRGEYEPIQTNRTAEGRKANRRIEVKLSLTK